MNNTLFQFKYWQITLTLIIVIIAIPSNFYAAETIANTDTKQAKPETQSDNNTQNIYRNINEDGVVEFSDQSIPNAKAIKIKSINTFKPAPKKNKINEAQHSIENENPIIEKVHYSNISITSPSQDQAIRSNNGTLSVSLSVKPTLNVAQGDQVELFIDGKSQGKQQSTAFSLKNLDRGQHSARATIVNQSGTVVKKSNTIKFSILRHSILFNPKPSP